MSSSNLDTIDKIVAFFQNVINFSHNIAFKAPERLKFRMPLCHPFINVLFSFIVRS